MRWSSFCMWSRRFSKHGCLDSDEQFLTSKKRWSLHWSYLQSCLPYNTVRYLQAYVRFRCAIFVLSPLVTRSSSRDAHASCQRYKIVYLLFFSNSLRMYVPSFDNRKRSSEGFLEVSELTLRSSWASLARIIILFNGKETSNSWVCRAITKSAKPWYLLLIYIIALLEAGTKHPAFRLQMRQGLFELSPSQIFYATPTQVVENEQGTLITMGFWICLLTTASLGRKTYFCFVIRPAFK